MVACLWRNRDLILALTRREVVGRYRGSVIGLAWSFFNPVLMLLVYTFVFSVVFKARWGIAGEEGKASFAIILFVGMIVHGLFAECINRAPNLILSNVNYVKRLVFPLEILPWVALGSAAFHAFISFLVLLLAQVLVNHHLPWSIVLFPVVVLPLILGTMGVAWFLSALGVYIRDIGQLTGILTTVMLFMAPVFYPITALPESYRPWLMLNPLTFIIEQGRGVLIWGHVPSWTGLLTYATISCFVAWIGFWWFQRTRKGFADVL